MANNFANAINSNIGAANSGATNTLTVTNPSNTASSQALVNVTVGGTSAGDAFTTYTVDGTTNWSVGVDNSVNDDYVLAASTALGTNNVWNMTSAGERTMPLQPAFLAYLPSSDLNVTGDATNFVLGSATALTEVFDQGADFNTNGTFTAPVTGRYMFVGLVAITGGTTITSMRSQFIASNRTMNIFCSGPLGAAATADSYPNTSLIVDMDAGDTCQLNIRGTDSGGKILDVTGSASLDSFFSGYLIC